RVFAARRAFTGCTVRRACSRTFVRRTSDVRLRPGRFGRGRRRIRRRCRVVVARAAESEGQTSESQGTKEELLHGAHALPTTAARDQGSFTACAPRAPVECASDLTPGM